MSRPSITLSLILVDFLRSSIDIGEFLTAVPDRNGLDRTVNPVSRKNFNYS